MSSYRHYEVHTPQLEPLVFAIPIYKGEMTSSMYTGSTYIALSPFSLMSIHTLMHEFMNGSIEILRCGTGTFTDHDEEIKISYSNDVDIMTERIDENFHHVFNLAMGFYPPAFQNKTISRHITHVTALKNVTAPGIQTIYKTFLNEFGYGPGNAVFETATICGYFIQQGGELYSESHKLNLRPIGDIQNDWKRGHYPLQITQQQ